MDVWISPNVAFVFSGATSLKLIPVMSGGIEKEECEPQLDCTVRVTVQRLPSVMNRCTAALGSGAVDKK